MSDVLIRPICAVDAPEVAELAGQLGYVRSAAEIGDWIVETTESRIVLVAEIDGYVVGWVQAHDLELLVHDPVLEIGGLVVAESQRGRGLGTLLLDEVIEWGRSRGHVEVWVRSNVVRERAHRFYEDLGFSRAKTSYTFTRKIG